MTSEPRTIVITSGSSGEDLGFVCIDSTINGQARGGLRLMPDLTPRELQLLARDMTLKYGFLGLPQGGAKGGVVGDPEAPPGERAGRLARFAEAAAPLLMSRAFVPDSDMGTTGADIQAMLESIGMRVARREYRGNRSGLYTAATVFESACAAADASGLALPGCRVAIEGFGRVGQPLAGMFVRAGARVVAVSTRRGGLQNPRGLDVEAIAERIRAGGDAAVTTCGLGDPIEATRLKFVPADVFCPCARHDSILLDEAGAIEAKVISCGANSPITSAAERELWKRGILCVPDFVANAGGVLGGTMEFAGWRTEHILEFFEQRFRPRVASLLLEARQSENPVRDVAEPFALSRFAGVKRLAEQDSWRGHAIEAALAAYRDGWLPGRLVRRLSVGYFRRRVG